MQNGPINQRVRRVIENGKGGLFAKIAWKIKRRYEMDEKRKPFWVEKELSDLWAMRENSRILYRGRVKGLTPEEITKAWHWGRKIEPLEPVDFGKN